jgi:hypothetical protein
MRPKAERGRVDRSDLTTNQGLFEDGADVASAETMTD